MFGPQLGTVDKQPGNMCIFLTCAVLPLGGHNCMSFSSNSECYLVVMGVVRHRAVSCALWFMKTWLFTLNIAHCKIYPNLW